MNVSKKMLLVVSMLTIFALTGCSGLSASVLPAGLLNAPADTSVLQGNALQASTPQASTTGTGTLADYQATLEGVYQKVNPSVVNVDVVISGATSFQGFQNSGTALGSGFVWDKQGHIVTNNHVVAGASDITVTFADGTVASATLVGADPNSDLAVIQVDVQDSLLQPVEVADSSQVKVGQVAIAVGNPFGLSGTMTVGIISALERSLPVGLDNQALQSGPTYTIPDIIQTDASINPGNSGGVLVNDQGQLIGVTAAIESPTRTNAGIGFVIPSAIVKRVVPSLISTGHYAHTWMGISGTTLTPELAKANNLESTQRGALVIDVTNGSPAEQAGLIGSTGGSSVNGGQIPTGGDVIIGIDNRTVNNFEDMVSYLFENTDVGQTVNLTVLRDGKQITVPLKLGSLPSSTGN
jgi:2-alkenal reductase